MSGPADRRGGLPVGHFDDLAPLEARVVAALRLWDPDGSTTGPARALGELLALCQHYGRRPLLRHAVGCPCLGADEACLARLVATAATGGREDAMLIATLMVRPDVAPALSAVAQDFGLGLARATGPDKPAPPPPQRQAGVTLH